MTKEEEEEKKKEYSINSEDSPLKTTVKKRKVASSSFHLVEMPIACNTAFKRFIPIYAQPSREDLPAEGLRSMLFSKKVLSRSSVVSKTVLVGPLSRSHLKLSFLVNLFNDAVGFENVFFALNNYQVFKGTAFVTFTTTEAAREAVEAVGKAAIKARESREWDEDYLPFSIKLVNDSSVEVAQQSRVQMDESELKTSEKKRVSGEQSAIYKSYGPINGGLESHQVETRHVSRTDGEKTIVSFERKFAEIALKFYEERQGAEFKVLEVLFSNRALLAVPGFGLERLWCHVSFIAKPRNALCSTSDDSPKHFFGEMVYNCATKEYDVNFCSIFELSDPANIEGCVFCPPNPIFVHPAHGCPAGGREIDKFMVEAQMDAGQISGCSKFHPERPFVVKDEEKNEQRYSEVFDSLGYDYAKIALEFFEKKEGAEFEIVEVRSVKHSPVYFRGSKIVTEWCEVRFKARPRNVDNRRYVPPQGFIGELLRSVTTRNYDVLYCRTIEMIDKGGYRPHRYREPAFSFLVGNHARYTIPEFPEYLVDASDLIC